MLPGKDCAVMDLSLVKLGCSTTEHGVGLALVVALAVTMEEGDVTYAGPAVFYKCGGMELRHNDMVLNYFSKLRKILRRTSECVRFWTDAGLQAVLIRTFFMCGGLMCEVFAYVFHTSQVDVSCNFVRLLSVGAMFWLWRTFVGFGYMAYTWADGRKYGIFGGYGGLLWLVW